MCKLPLCVYMYSSSLFLFGERPSHDDVVIAIIIIITIITFYHILLLPILRLKITRHIRYVVSKLPRVNCLK